MGDLDIVFHAGDILTTAGFGVEVPGGLMVGELVADEQGQIAPLSENLYRRARLKPMAAHYHQTKVVVLVRQK